MSHFEKMNIADSRGGGRMFLMVDGCPLQTPARDRGIGRYTSALLDGLRTVRPDWRIELVEHTRLEAIPLSLTQGLTVRKFTAPLSYDLHAPEHRAVNDRYFADWVNTFHPDHLLIASMFERLGVVPRFVGDHTPVSAVMYDLIPILFPQQYGLLQPGQEWYARRLQDIAGTDLLFAISEAAAEDSRRLLGPQSPKTVNIRGAVSPHFVPLSDATISTATATVKQKFAIADEFILYVGGEDYRKNVLGAVDGFATLPAAARDGMQLVIACRLPDWIRAEIHRKAEQYGIAHQVMTTGFVSDEELLVLYQACRVFFFPSLYEGLGLPVLEALRCGAPVVCSDGSSLPEFAGPASWLCDPRDRTSMANALAQALAEPKAERREERVAFAQSFTWEQTAEQVASEIEICPPTREANRPRVAWVAANPPQGSLPGIFATPLLTQLAEYLDIELVLPSHQADDRLAKDFRIIGPDEVEARHDAAPFDLFIYQVGAEQPGPMIETLARRHRGLLVLDNADPTAFHERSVWQLTLRSAGIVVPSASVRHWVRGLADVPTVLLPDMSTRPALLPVCTALFAEAVRDTIDRLDRTDLRWTDVVANALAEVTGPIPSNLIDEWIDLRKRSRVREKKPIRSADPKPTEASEPTEARPDSIDRAA